MAGKTKTEEMTGGQKDALQKMRDTKKASLKTMVADGKVDPGDAVLDPAEFDKYDAEYRTSGAETERIEAILKEHLDGMFEGYTWETGFFLEKDPRSQGAKGYKVLQVSMLGDVWSAQLQHEAGLENFSGAVVWNGRGTFERHIVCVKTTQLHDRQQAAKGQRLAEQMQAQPQSVAGERTGAMKVTETHKKMPLIPVGEGTKSEEGSAAETTD